MRAVQRPRQLSQHPVSGEYTDTGSILINDIIILPSVRDSAGVSPVPEPAGQSWDAGLVQIWQHAHPIFGVIGRHDWSQRY